jgi:predicted nucleic acid-binding protein
VKRHEDWLLSLKLQFVPVDYILVGRDLRLLVNRGAESYDAIYIYLARKLGHALWTCDTGILSLSQTSLKFGAVDLHSGPQVP